MLATASNCTSAHTKHIPLNPSLRNLVNNMIFPMIKLFSESWILPFTVLVGIVVYSVMALVFYNNDG